MRVAFALVCCLAALVVVDAASECQNDCNSHGLCLPKDSQHSTWWCGCFPGWNGADCSKQTSPSRHPTPAL